MNMVTEYIKNFFLSGDDITQSFRFGCITGVATLLVLFIFAGILSALCRRRKRSDGITLDSELGEIFISATAISSAIMSLEQDFDAYVIQKVRLYESGRDKIAIQVQICYDSKGGCFKPYTENFQKKVIARLKEMFGIDNIEKIRIDLKNGVNVNATKKEGLVLEDKVFSPEPDQDPVVDPKKLPLE